MKILYLNTVCVLHAAAYIFSDVVVASLRLRRLVRRSVRLMSADSPSD